MYLFVDDTVFTEFSLAHGYLFMSDIVEWGKHFKNSCLYFVR